MDESDHYRLRWNNHLSNLLGVFSQLLHNESLVDVTLASSEGPPIRAHKVVLSACSSFFQALFLEHPAQNHPIVILKDVPYLLLKTLVEFMYKGEVHVERSNLETLLKIAENLKIKGLAEMTQEQLEKPRFLATENDVEKPRFLGVEEEDSVKPGVLAENLMRAKHPEEKGDHFGGNSEDCDSDDGGVVEDETLLQVPGTSSSVDFPPVQEAPLSLKKEVDFGGGSSEEFSTNFKELPETSSKPSSSSRSSSRSSPPPTLPPLLFPSLASSIFELPISRRRLLTAAAAAEEFYRCSSCMAGFPSVWLLEQHNALQHLTNESFFDKPFVCEQCGQSYRYRSSFLKHRDQNHLARPPATKPFTCDVCGMQFRYVKSFKKHRLNHHLEKLHETAVEKLESNAASEVPAAPRSPQTAPRRFACPFCGKCVRSKENLKLHVRKHTGERPFACLFCGRAFGGKSDLTRHLRIHTGERPYRCDACGKRFARADYLSKHLTTHVNASQ